MVCLLLLEEPSANMLLVCAAAFYLIWVLVYIYVYDCADCGASGLLTISLANVSDSFRNPDM